MNSQNTEELSPADTLKQRLYTLNAKCQLPKILPDENPQFPKKPATVQSSGVELEQETKYSIIKLTDTKRIEDATVILNEERALITNFTQPEEAIIKLQSAVKGTFFYMQRADILKEGDMFHYLVCPHIRITGRDYYTISLKGVTHIEPGNENFTTLEEWLDEQKKLEKLREIPIFKNFRIWKPLYLLKKAVPKNRRIRSLNLLTSNLFTANNYLRKSLFIVLECTDGIRSLEMIETDEYKGRRTTNELIKYFEDFNYGKVEVFNEEEGYEEQAESVVVKLPFTIEQFESLTVKRCTELSQLLDSILTSISTETRQSIDSYIVQLFAQESENEDSDNHDNIESTQITYTERAARMNACKRMLNYLRLTDFMLMDSLYDFAYLTLEKIKCRMESAGQHEMPGNVIASEDELLEREKEGLYRFGDDELGEDIPEQEEAISKELGDNKFVFFSGKIICKLESFVPQTPEVKGPIVREDSLKSMLSNLSNESWCAPIVRKQPPGPRELREQDDPRTPGDNVGPGKIAKIMLSPSYLDFQRSFDGFTESLLSVETSVRRLMNHEEFEDISLPVLTGDVQNNNSDATKIELLQEIQAPDLKVLFTSNVGFSTLTEEITSLMKQQYEKAAEWTTCLQPFFDAFNDCMNLDIGTIENKLFGHITSSWAGPASSLRSPKEYQEYYDEFNTFLFTNLQCENNEFDEFEDSIYSAEFKEILAQVEQFSYLKIKSKNDVPFTVFENLNKFTMQDLLISDQQFNDLLMKMEHYRRLHYSMPERINLKLYSFDMIELKKAFMPVSERVLDYFKAAIPLSVYKRLFLLEANIFLISKYLNNIPTQIEDFIVYKEVVELVSEEVVDNIKAISDNAFELLEMYLEHFKSIPKEVEIMQTTFLENFDIFKSQVNFIESGLDNHINKELLLLDEQCKIEFESLQELATQMRLKSLNRTINLFTMLEMSEFFNQYSKSLKQRKDEEEEIKNELTIALNKQEKIGTFPELEQEIKTLEIEMLPEYMLCNDNDLTYDILMEEHEFLLDNREIEEEESEEDGLGNEVIEESQSNTEEETPESEVENSKASNSIVNMEDSNNEGLSKEELRKLVESEIPPFNKLCSVFIHLKNRTLKTNEEREELDKVEQRIKTIEREQTSLNEDPTDFPLLEKVSTHIREYDNLWQNSMDFEKNEMVFLKQNFFGELNHEELIQFVQEESKIASQCERSILASEMPAILKQRITELRQIIPVIQSLDNMALKERHWDEVGKALNVEIPKVAKNKGEKSEVEVPDISINWLVFNKALTYKDELSEVSSNAANEQSLENAFLKIKDEWQVVDVEIKQHTSFGDIFVLYDTAELTAQLDDSLLVVQGLASSKYAKPIQEDVNTLLRELSQLATCLEVFLLVQKGYLYLLNIFSSGDIERQLPNETKMFEDLDNFWRKLMSKIYDKPRAIEITTYQITEREENTNPKISVLEAELKKYATVLDTIQKSLDDFLYSKRMAFPRLFFISDEELLDLLALAKNPLELNQHMRKLFENIVSLDMYMNEQAGGLEIYAINSEEGEKMKLIENVKPRGSLTVWLITLEQKIKQTVAKSIKDAIESYKDYKDRGVWLKENHAQSIIAASNVFWCANITESLGGNCGLKEAGLMKPEEYDKKQSILKQYLIKYENDLIGLVALINGGLSKLERAAITALATIETHNRDTIQVLIDEEVTSVDQFEFEKLLRYYYLVNEIDNELRLRENTTEMPYMNEYLGASSRLVITPLTDLVYLHIACCMENAVSVACMGPAGTGKSETTKDQCKARGDSCVVFNCSDNVEVKVMNRFFMGFCMTGAGSCLDEFNRLELSLLSVIAGSIKQINDGLRLLRGGKKQDSFLFEGSEIQLSDETMISISLNPGYAGRTELPENLKNLFRTFSMVVPDYALISEIILFSQGFSESKPLSRKIVQLYKLSSEELSENNAYDFGMRGIKSVLSMAGNLRRKYIDQTEELVLIRAMEDSNLPRMIADDRELFMGIINDLFPSIIYEKSINADFEKCIERSMKDNHLEYNDVMVEKVSQLFETCEIRHGVCIMGSAKSGKSTALLIMVEALGYLRQLVNETYTVEQRQQFNSNFPTSVVNSIELYNLNPVAETIDELYGSYDETSGEWHDGLLGNIMRTCLSETKNEESAKKEIINLNAPVNTIWVESANSLLDDSKLLCLANSERLKINDFISLLIESEDLKEASPATVSRLGIIYFPDCPLLDIYKIEQVELKPENLTSLSDDEIEEYERKVLESAVNISLKESIVRWDHIVDSWLENNFDKLLSFETLKGVPDNELECENVEDIMYNHVKGVIVQLCEILIPIGLKYASSVENELIPTNEIELVEQLLKIFESIFCYNRSQCVSQENENEREMNKYAEDNGLLEVPRAEDITRMAPLDLSLFIRFTALEYVYRNEHILESPPTPEELYNNISQFVQNSEFYKQFDILIKNLFMYAFIWAFGGILAAGNNANKEEFDNLVRTAIEDINEEYLEIKLQEAQGNVGATKNTRMAPFNTVEYEDTQSIQLSLIPNQGTVFDYYIDWTSFDKQEDLILNAFSCIPVKECIREFDEKLYNKGNDEFKIMNIRDIIMNLEFVSGIFESGIEEITDLLENEAIVLPIEFVTFTELIPKFNYNPSIPFSSIFIDTEDTIRYKHLVESLIKHDNHILLTGTSGSGKSCTINSLLSDLDKREEVQTVEINFSAKTSSARVESIIEDSLDKRKKNLLGPEMGKLGILFIDDLNLPVRDIYECSPPIEFLRFLLDFHGFYDKKELFMKYVSDTNILAACAPPGGGREELTARLTSSMIIISEPESDDVSLIKIYDQILSSHLNYYKYNDEVISSSTGIIKSLLQIYHNIAEILKPTPSKMHYIFTLRDVSKVVEGLLRAEKATIKTTDDFISLFRHEIMRVFADRVVCQFDRECVCKEFVDVLNTEAGTGLKKALTYEPTYDEFGAVLNPLEPPPVNFDFEEMWGNYMRMNVPEEERTYERAKDFRNNQQLMQEYLSSYNESLGTQKMNLILFEDAVYYVNKIAKVLSSERGNLMNVGVGGSGRKSLTRLAAYMCEFDVETIQLKKGYSQEDFHEDVKELYLKCGLEGKNLVFLLDESELVSNEILEDINNILNSGLIANLFEADEMDNILQTTRQYVNDNNLSEIVDTSNKASVFNFFINRVRDRLHIVLCLSPSGDEFRDRLRTYPSLLTCMSIVWFNKWPQSALLDVSSNILKESLEQVNFSTISGTDDANENQQYAKKLASKLAPLATEIHSNTEKLLDEYYKETNRRHYLPPATFLSLLKVYSILLENRITEISTKFTRFETGVIKLDDAKEEVAILKKEEEELKPELEKSTFKTNELIQEVDKDKVKVDEMKQNAEQDESIVASETKECEMMTADAQRELDECEPIIEAAIKALDSINAGDIAEMKRVQTPTKLVKMVMESIAVLLGYKTDWPGCELMLGETSFIKLLENYDKDNISDQMLKKLKIYTENEDYEPARIEKVSVACKSLSQWVIAVEKYSYVNREVEPKRQRLAAAKGELQKKEVVLAEKEAKLAEVTEQFMILTETLSKNQDELHRLEKEMSLTKERLERAEKLTSALADERIRWLEESAQLKELLKRVVGDVFIASCGVSYFGVFTRQFRQKLMKYWYGLLEIYEIECSDLKSIEKGLFGLLSSDEMQIEIWKEFGLPNDQESIDNAVIIEEVLNEKWPLLIDPENEASSFIKEMESANQIIVLRPTQSGIVRKFEAAIRSGIPILYDGVGEKIDPSLLPIIERQYTTDGVKNMVKLGDEPVEVHPNFRLYITTKLQNPKYSPETHAKLEIINFSIASDALEQELLSDIIKLEYPDLEKARIELTAESSADKKLLTKLAGDILYQLSSFEGSVLDNEGLIEVLNESKATSEAIIEKDKASVDTRAEIELYYNMYRPIAVRTALIYFLISDMSLVESMYLFSLSYYKQCVLGEVEKIDDYRNSKENMQNRVQNLIEKLTFNLFTSISRGLFEKDKFVFAFLLGCRIQQMKGEISEEEWELLIKGNIYADIFNQDIENRELSIESKQLLEVLSTTQELPENIREQVKVMCQVPYLHELAEIFIQEFISVEEYLVQNNQQTDQLVEYMVELEDSQEVNQQFLFNILSKYELSTFQRLIFVKLLSDEYFYIVLPTYIQLSLDNRFSNIRPEPLELLYNDSTQFSPMLFIISEGVDPVAEAEQLAEEEKKYFHIISLGKGQTPAVRELLKQATSDGSWIFLENVHLASKDFLPELEVIVESLALSKENQISNELDYLTLPPNESFRLFLSSTPIEYFPESVLQASLKCTTEPPIGMKNNLIRETMNISNDVFEFRHYDSLIQADYNKEGVVATWKRLVFAIMYFHSNLLERKKFKAEGFNLSYDFNDTDTQICLIELEDFFKTALKQNANNELESFLDLDWNAIEFIFGQIHYGGKINDQWDKRTVMTILRGIICEELVEKSATQILQPFSYLENDELYSPSFITNTTTINDIISKIEALPPIDSTKVFGMSENSAVVNEESESQRVIERVLSVSSECLKDNSKSNENENDEQIVLVAEEELENDEEKKSSRDERAKQIKKEIELLNLKVFGEEIKETTVDEIIDGIALNLLNKLPKEIDINEASPKALTYDEQGKPHCLTTILKQEMERFNNLLSTLKQSLENVRLAIKGDLILSSDLEAVYKSLFIGQVPASWSVIAYPSLKPLASWFADLLLRIQSIRQWLTQGKPKSFWISGLYFPQGFCTALLETHARKYKIPVDSLRFDFYYSNLEWSNYKGDEIDSEAEEKDATWIHGLYLDCGFFNTETLQLEEPKLGLLYPKMPFVRFLPVDSHMPEQQGYECPVYKTSQRAGVLSSTGHSTNFILPLVVPSSLQSDKFIRLGTAALCELDE